jgi:putative methyltransferase (TIGR04325 family)
MPRIQALRSIATQLVPPALLVVLRRLRRALRRTAPEWEYLADGWPDVLPGTGWEHASIVELQRSKWPVLVAAASGTAPLGISHEGDAGTTGDSRAHNSMISFGYSLALAAAGRDRIAVLDWGGGLGQYALFARALLPGTAIDYVVLDLPAACDAGPALGAPATFVSDPARIAGRTFDLVVASGSMHYSREWRDTLSMLASACHGHALITRLPVVESAASYVMLQRPHAFGYHTEYPGWALNRRELLAAAGTLGLELVRELVVAEEHEIPGAPEQPVYRGFLFARSAGGR